MPSVRTGTSTGHGSRAHARGGITALDGLTALAAESESTRRLGALQREADTCGALGPVHAVLQRVIDDSGLTRINDKLSEKGLGTYDAVTARFSATKIAALEKIWDQQGKGKKPAKKNLAAIAVVKKIEEYGTALSGAAAAWTAATYASAQASLDDHFQRHPGAWGDIDEYTQAALAFKAQKWGNRYPVPNQANRQRMQDATYFLITTNAGLIVTFGDR
jgi:hypothetical protein